MKKKILLIIFIMLLVGSSFIVGRQVGLNTEDSKTKTIVKEEMVGTEDIKKTLTGSGQVSSKTTEKLDLSTSYYFKTMCVEDDDTVKEGENILQYTNGTYLTAPYDLVEEVCQVVLICPILRTQIFKISKVQEEADQVVCQPKDQTLVNSVRR
ncbi:MAG: hypothetical protein IKD77_00065 [Bacilli bacterium]|nr:hypothetical protein [Bacilli bacterium]